VFVLWNFEEKVYVGRRMSLGINHVKLECYQINSRRDQATFNNYDNIIADCAQSKLIAFSNGKKMKRWTLRTENSEIVLACAYTFFGAKFNIDNSTVAEQCYLFHNPLKILRGIYAKTTIIENKEMIPCLLSVLVLSSVGW
jgi:hypothetical protein